MKNRLMPLLLSAGLFSMLNLSVVIPSAVAQPDTAAPGKMTRKGKPKVAKATRGGVPKRMMAKIEETLGKPLTEDQKTRLNAAYKARAEAQKAAAAKFLTEVSAVTGLTAEQAASLNKRTPKAGAAAAG